MNSAPKPRPTIAMRSFSGIGGSWLATNVGWNCIVNSMVSQQRAAMRCCGDWGGRRDCLSVRNVRGLKATSAGVVMIWVVLLCSACQTNSRGLRFACGSAGGIRDGQTMWYNGVAINPQSLHLAVLLPNETWVAVDDLSEQSMAALAAGKDGC